MAANQEELLVKDSLIQLNSTFKSSVKSFESGLNEAKAISTALKGEDASGRAWGSLVATMYITMEFQKDLIEAAKEIAESLEVLEKNFKENNKRCKAELGDI